MSKAYVVGLTGGIGSGKSAVTREFERLGVPIVDADIVAREVVMPGTPGLLEIIDTFGTDVLAPDGTLDRAALRDIVFADPDAKLRLESILHPKIRTRIAAKLDEVTAPYVILCVPLLVERRGYESIDRILVVDCDEKVQIERVMARDGLTRPQVEAIMQTQASRQERLAKADDIIDNSGDLASLSEPVASLHEQYILASQRRG